MKICVVRLSALGDIVMMMPLIRTLQGFFPDAEITWVVSRPFDGILKRLEGVRILPIKKIQTIRDYWTLRKKFKGETFDLLLCCQASMSAHLIYSLIRARRKIGYDVKRGKDFHRWFVREKIPFRKQHTLEGFLEFAKVLGAHTWALDGRVPLGQEERDWVLARLGEEPYAVINPCASREERNWSTSNYAELINFIVKEKGLRVVLTGGPKDRLVCDEILRLTSSHVINLAGETTLLQMTALIEKARFVVAPDTGPIHIASGLGRPVIGLYAASDRRLSGPYFHLEFVVDKFFDALRTMKGEKQPERVWNCRIREKGAMELIELKEVIEKVALFA